MLLKDMQVLGHEYSYFIVKIFRKACPFQVVYQEAETKEDLEDVLWLLGPGNCLQTIILNGCLETL